MRKMILGAAVATAMHLVIAPAFAAQPNQLSDERVRQAIAYAIDMDTIVETLLEGKALVADSMIPNGDFKAEGLNAYTYDPDKARALLEEAGWDDSQVLDVVYYYGDQLTVDLMVALQAYLADVGVQMTYRKIEGDVAGQLNTVPEDGSDTSGGGMGHHLWRQGSAGPAGILQCSKDRQEFLRAGHAGARCVDRANQRQCRYRRTEGGLQGL